MKEIADGIFHWTARHPNIGIEVSSYWLPGPGVLIDPLQVPDDVDAVEEIVLTNRHHRRGSFEARERFGTSRVRVPRTGLHEFDLGDPVEPYDFGDRLARGEVVVHEVGVICPDEAALHVPSVKALAVADGVVHYDGLRFVPDHLLDDPEDTKRGLKEVYARLADQLEFEHLLTAHGPPVAGSGREDLRAFAAS